ncbi:MULTISPECIES: AlwI family type II restriction endonuclease [unclassified Campylobacter]|uniref:AlwI family type II restriction endonuclease n=1 Tax=unclassified Campylobacter TaxID=2593542 RepID=UPI0022E9EDDB|nr:MULTISPECIES: AlwI family type II restriction endonuclease [unclassified Campylobacter]MDA3062470.1 AlwI family type II restriction endonuclease [Campylobacter sp. JMF_14 EL1]MDA3073411.1 AlwI family type II restriction endonuclease [Campylobacter sp. JMF_10 EL2]
MPKQEYKILSFSTTMRNPSRIAKFIEILAHYENHILTHEIIMQIVAKIIKNRLYETMFEKKFYKDKLENETEFSDDEIKNIIENSPQKHKEAGFDYGWDSRFDTWYKLPMEFGFCFYAMNKPILISNVGHMLINAANENPINENKISDIFLNSMMKYQRNNPFRRVLNQNVPLILLLQTMKNLKIKIGDSKIHRQEIPFFTCWEDGDSEKLTNFILDFRAKFPSFRYSDDIIYEKALEILKSSNQKRFKKVQICGESIDEYIRKMRITRLISLRGNGRFIDLNSFESEKIDYVLANYSTFSAFNDKFEFYQFMGEIDNGILGIASSVDLGLQNDIKLETLQKFATNYTKEQIYNELSILAHKKSSKDEVFKFIPEPTRFEFLASIALKQNFANLEVLPNYHIDDEGLPTSHASGNMPDIICDDEKSHSLTEVSLICGRAQVNNELLPISRHLKDEISKNIDKQNFAIFVAPKIFDDSKRYVKFIKYDENLDIINLDIENFIIKLQKSSEILDLLNV